MKNTNNITKYVLALQVALLAVVLLVSTPILALADDSYNYDNSDYSDDSYNYDNTDYSDDSYNYSDDSYNYSDDSYDYSDDSYDYSDDSYYYYPTTRYVSSGGFYGGYSSYVPRYYYNGNSTVTSGGFSGGTLTIVPPTTYTTNPYVTSGGFTGGTYNYPVANDPLLTASCYASVNNNQTVTWSANATGGNGFYNYSWTGDEGLSGTGASVTRSYSFAGTKTANVTITSNSQSITRTCSANVGPVQNQVLAFTDTNPGLQSVYLSDVPYTGAGDTIRMISFILGLILWSILVAYIFLKRKYNLQNIFAPVAITETPNTDTKIQDILSNQIASDSNEISFVEEYARLKKVILSTDASVKLVKLQRLGTASAIAIVDKLSGSEWIAVGESDIESYR